MDQANFLDTWFGFAVVAATAAGAIMSCLVLVLFVVFEKEEERGFFFFFLDSRKQINKQVFVTIILKTRIVLIATDTTVGYLS